MLEQQGEMRFAPHGRSEIVARTGLELAQAGVEVPTHIVAQSLGDTQAQAYEQAIKKQRQK